MLRIRETESTLLKLYAKGLLSGTVHTSIGQEACAVGIVSQLDRSLDILYSSHRGHGHFLAYCGNIRGLIAEVFGRQDGICGGLGGSQHIHQENFYSNGIQGAGVSVVAGMALAEKLKESDAVAVAFLGDGTFGEGAVYEGLNIAALWNLPVILVVEDNGYAQSTPSNLQHAGQLRSRSISFGIPVAEADGMDVVSVYSAARTLVDAVRESQSPQMLYLPTCRFGPHSKGDDFRKVDEIEAMHRRDPIIRLEKELDAAKCRALRDAVASEVDAIVEEFTRQ